MAMNLPSRSRRLIWALFPGDRALGRKRLQPGVGVGRDERYIAVTGEHALDLFEADVAAADDEAVAPFQAQAGDVKGRLEHAAHAALIADTPAVLADAFLARVLLRWHCIEVSDGARLVTGYARPRSGTNGRSDPLLLSRRLRLIITEKNNSAKKIAEILSSGEAKSDATYKVPFYTWTDSEGDQMTVGLKGHVMGVAFPDGYSNWQETDLHELIDAELVPEPTDKNVVKAVRKLVQGSRRGRHRNRLRPRGRADRPRGAAAGARREPQDHERCSLDDIAEGRRARPRSSAPATRR